MKLRFLSKLILFCGTVSLFSTTAMAQPESKTFSTAGTYVYEVPAGYSTIVKVEAWGAGAGGSGKFSGPKGSGGGGGAYSAKTLTLTPASYTVIVGKGGNGAHVGATSGSSITANDGENSTFDGSALVAYGGLIGGSGLDTKGGAGGAANPSADVSYKGGNGGDGVPLNTYGPGGGGSAWATGAGLDGKKATALDGGKGGLGQGNGGEGGSVGDRAGNGLHPGGGGGGRYVGDFSHNSGNGADGQVIITVESSTVLPANFGNFSAIREGNQFSISFTTLQETNNDHFNLQSSQNGVDFTTLATIQSKHADGSASGSTTYEFTLDIAGKISFAVSLFALLGIGVLGFNRKTRVLIAALFLMGVAGFIVSCTKNTNELASKTAGKAFLRIEQVDKNGHSSYSKIITITNE